MGWLRVWVEYVGAGGRLTPRVLILSPLELAPEGTRRALDSIFLPSLIYVKCIASFTVNAIKYLAEKSEFISARPFCVRVFCHRKSQLAENSNSKLSLSIQLYGSISASASVGRRARRP